MQKAIYFVGSNNTTKELETDKIHATLTKYYSGYTVYKVQGYWKGQSEDSMRVEVLTDDTREQLETVARDLRDTLTQDAVLLEVETTKAAFI